MSTTTNALRRSFATTNFLILDDDIALSSTTTQAGAYPVKGEVARVTKASASSSLVLKPILSGDAPPTAFVINETAGAIVVFSAAGEKLGGSTNGSLSIPAGQIGFFLAVPNDLGGPDWRAAAVA